jgi:hypothetical protein
MLAANTYTIPNTAKITPSEVRSRRHKDIGVVIETTKKGTASGPPRGGRCLAEPGIPSHFAPRDFQALHNRSSGFRRCRLGDHS